MRASALVLAALLAAPVAAVKNGAEMTEATKPALMATALIMMESEKPDGPRAACTGVLVDKNVILTAAHCFGKDLGIKLHPADIMLLQSATRQPAGFVVYPGYENGGRGEDLALIALAGPPVDDRALPQWAEPTAKVVPGDTFVIVGGGTAGGRKIGHASTALLQVKAVDAAAGTTDTVSKDGRANACGGDSGGPAFLVTKAGMRLAGIVVAGSDPACKYPDLNTITLLRRHQNWLNEKIAGLQAAADNLNRPAAAR